MAPDNILLLDAFFTVVVHHGTTIAQWRKLGYQNLPEHAHFSALLNAPQEDAAALCAERCPLPRLVICDQHGSQARGGREATCFARCGGWGAPPDFPRPPPRHLRPGRRSLPAWRLALPFPGLMGP